MKLRVCLFIALGLAAFGQTGAPLAPELAPLAAKHKADFAVVEQQRATALAAKLPFYTNALDAAEKSALSGGYIPAVAAIRKEREAVKGGLIGDLIAAPFPENLPAGLKDSRDALFKSFRSIEADSLKLRQRADAEYLRMLTALQAGAAANPELARQIKAESDAVLGNPVTTPEGEVEAAAKKGKLLNGNFTEADANGFPLGWKLVNRRMLENPLPAGETYKVQHDNGRSLFHTARENATGDGLRAMQVVEGPQFARQCKLEFQSKGVFSGKTGGWMIAIIGEDKNGTGIDHAGFNIGQSSTWKTYSGALKLDEGKSIKQVRVLLNASGLGGVKGYIDYARVELTFK